MAMSSTRTKTLSALILLANMNVGLTQSNPNPGSCEKFTLWHASSKLCVTSPNKVHFNTFLGLAETCGEEGFFKRFTSQAGVPFTMMSDYQHNMCIHPKGGYPYPTSEGILWHKDECYDTSSRLAHVWNLANDELGSVYIKPMVNRNLCLQASGQVGDRIKYGNCGIDEAKFVVSCDGANPFTRTTTSTGTTTTTTATTATAITATNTILQQLDGQLSNVEALLEQQILKYDKHVMELTTSVKAVQDMMKMEHAAYDIRFTALETSNTKLTDTLESIRSTLMQVGDQNDDDDFFQEPATVCSDSSDSIPRVETDGTSMTVSACAGDIFLQSQTCSVNPCQLQANVGQLLDRLDKLTKL